MEFMYYMLFITILGLYAWFAWHKPGWGLGLVPAALAVCVLTAVGMNDPFYAVCSPLLLISVLLIADRKEGKQAERSWYQFTASILLTGVGYLAIFIVTMLFFNLLGPVFFFLLVVSIGYYHRCSRYNTLNSLLATVSLSIRRSMPLPTAIEAASHGQKRKTAKIYQKLAYWLSQGWSFSDAMAKSFRKCPAHVLASIRSAEKIHQLPAAIESIQADLVEKMENPEKNLSGFLGYPFFVFFTVIIATLGLFIFIIPTFGEVLSDMSDGQAGLPRSLQLLLNVSYWLLDRQGLNALMFTLVFILVTCFVLFLCTHRRRPGKTGMLSWFADSVKWHLPLVRWFERSHGNLQLCQHMRIALQSGCPLDQGLGDVTGLDINWYYRRQIEDWISRIRSGEKTAAAARAAGLDKPLAWAFDDTINRGNTPGVLENLEASYRGSISHRQRMLMEVSWPFLILAVGTMVGYVVYALFMGSFSLLMITLEYVVPF